MNTVASFIVVLGILIFVHELGHFLFAKLFGVRVLVFSLGFGPKLFSRTVGETEYVISAFPLGGYVKMFGENPDEQQEAVGEREVSFAHKTVWQRFLIVFAGPLFNLLFTVVLFFLIFSFVGLPDSRDTTRVGEVTTESPAALAGMKADDTILTINGHPTRSWLDVLNLVKDSKGEELQILVARGEEEVELAVTPTRQPVKNIFGEEVEQRFMIGVVKADELFYSDVGPVGALQAACIQTWMYIELTVMGFVKLVQQVIPAS
ncbi:MAG: site-2 protease family protein, partial [Thermodesulfobacteriota bacterium]